MPLKPLCFRRQGATALNDNTIPKLLQLFDGGRAFDLRPVAAPMAKAWVGEALLQATVAGEDQQPFAVGIESPRGVHLGHINKVAQATPPASLLRRELTQNPEGFVQQQRRQISLRFRASSTG